MLKKCPECELQVSDKAFSCPHCGYPFQTEAKKYTTRKNRRRRLPNGFGQISEIKNRNLRKPFRAMLTVGFDPETGRPICKSLKPTAYFETYNDAYAALVAYNKNPFELNTDLTLQELWEKWYENRTESNVADTTLRQYKAAWTIAKRFSTTKVKDLKIMHIKACIEEAQTNSAKRMVKILFNLILDYAVEYDIVEKNVSRQYVSHNLNQEPEQRKQHIPYTENELESLWKNINSIYGVDLLLIQCYTGMRPQEIGLIKVQSFNKDKMYFVGGLKTKDGKNRVIPVHSRIQNIILEKYNESLSLGSEYLINYTKDYRGGIPQNYMLTYARYKGVVQNIIKQLRLNPEHKGHDGRNTFVTMAKRHGLDEYAIKRIVGHHISDLTERVYTERDVEWLRSEIEKIK